MDRCVRNNVPRDAHVGYARIRWRAALLLLSTSWPASMVSGRRQRAICGGSQEGDLAPPVRTMTPSDEERQVIGGAIAGVLRLFDVARLRDDAFAGAHRLAWRIVRQALEDAKPSRAAGIRLSTLLDLVADCDEPDAAELALLLPQIARARVTRPGALAALAALLSRPPTAEHAPVTPPQPEPPVEVVPLAPCHAYDGGAPLGPVRDAPPDEPVEQTIARLRRTLERPRWRGSRVAAGASPRKNLEFVR